MHNTNAQIIYSEHVGMADGITRQFTSNTSLNARSQCSQLEPVIFKK